MAKEIKEISGELLRVGEIELLSQSLTMEELASVVLTLLDNKSVKEYLELLKSKRLNGSYLG